VTAGDGGISITASKTSNLSPGETITVTLSGATYRGFLLKSADSAMWSNPPASTQLWSSCSGYNSVGHSDGTDKTTLSFDWTAPSTAGSYNIEGYAVVTHNPNVWHSLNTVSVAVSASTPTAAPTAAPTLPCTQAQAACLDPSANNLITNPIEVSSNQVGGTGSDSFHDANSEVLPAKHDPLVISASMDSNGDTTIKVVVRGSDGATGDNYLHPMSSSHYISTIYIKDQNDDVVFLLQFDPNAIVSSTIPVATFTLPPSVTSVTPYEYCNLHGLWKGVTVSVPFSSKTNALEASCFTGISSGPTSAHNASNPAIKHDPAITTIVKHADGSHTVNVLVRGVGGSESTLHPNTYGHWIEAIYVKDQDGNVIFLREFTEPVSGTSDGLGTYPTAHTFFNLPSDTTVTELHPFEYCNLHGLWQGPPVAMAAISSSAPSPSPATAQSGLGDLSMGDSVGVVFGTMLAIFAAIGVLPDLAMQAYVVYAADMARVPGNSQSDTIELVTDKSCVASATGAAETGQPSPPARPAGK